MSSKVTKFKRHVKRRVGLNLRWWWFALKSLFVNYESKILSKKLSKGTILKSIYLEFAQHPTSDVVLKSCANIKALEPFAYNKTIFVTFHQFFIQYLIVWLCRNGVKLSTLKYRNPNRKRPERLNVKFLNEILESSDLYEPHVYKPVLSLKYLMDRLNEGGNVFILADLAVEGNHFIDVPFGGGTISTPKGIYALSQQTGATIVPLWLSYKGFSLRPKIEIKRGESFIIEGDVEDEMHKVENLMKWFYERAMEEPYTLSMLLKNKNLKRI